MKTYIKQTLLSLGLLAGAFTAQAQVKIGDSPTTINAGSVLELQSTNKGLLMPRINLASTTTWGLLGTPAAGMHVYNTNTGIISGSANYPILDAKVGEYYWDGTGWVAIAREGTQNSPVLFSVNINAITLIAGAAQKVTFGSSAYDKNNHFNLATDQFVVPANGAGYYQINAGLTTTQIPGGGLYMWVYVNNSERRLLASGNTVNGGILAEGAAAIKLNAGDIVDFQISSNAGTTVDYGFVDMYLISR